MVKLTHISDTHGMLPRILQSSSIIVHSGDFLPNCTRGKRVIEEKYQEAWLRDN